MAAPTIVSAAIGATGLTLSVVYSEAVITQGAMNAPAITNAYRGLTSTGTTSSGSGTATFVYTLDKLVYAGETVLMALGAAAVKSVSTVEGNLIVAGQAVTNNSALTVPRDGKAARLLVNSCTIRRKINSQSATSAGLKTDWGDAYVGVACNAQGASQSESLTWGIRVGDSGYRVYLPKTADILAQDRLTDFVGPCSIGATDTLEVVSDALDHAGRGAYTVVMAKAVHRNG